MAIHPADCSSLVKIYSSASQGLHKSSWQCQVVGVSALVRTRQDYHQDSGLEGHMLQWLQLVQVGVLDRTALILLTESTTSATPRAVQPQAIPQTHRHHRRDLTLAQSSLAPPHRVRCCPFAGSRRHRCELDSRRGDHRSSLRKARRP
jgi:hypothetical protein